ncbi:sulfite exporter TauE/SafE family protein [Nostoc sp. 3335mG]|nr:sulfite exporter TauE/SafE family protein [Nostoc sp. 3335mG]
MEGLAGYLAGLDTQVLVLAALAAALAGCARGFSGFGGALIFVPLASSLIGPKLATAILLIVDGVLTLGMVPDGWRRANRREVFTMAVGALFGVPLGTALLALAPALTLRWIICGIVLVLLAFLVSGWRYHGTPRPHYAVGVGALAGLFGGAAQMSGPPVVAYWLGGAFPARTVRANLVVYFAVSSIISASAYLFAGLLTGQALLLSALIGPSYGLGLLAGARLFGLASETTFRRICFMLIACSALVSLPLFDALRS